ncbi:hypothetical protein, partial [Actinomyces procaprae]|uniref:hypothetical protein n=1 Tax=Actinomyces procaprae TaxID=2560010 RepID=UPI001B3463F3
AFVLSQDQTLQTKQKPNKETNKKTPTKQTNTTHYRDPKQHTHKIVASPSGRAPLSRHQSRLARRSEARQAQDQ